MKMKHKAFLLIALVAFISIGYAQPVQYQLTFNATWSLETHPLDWPNFPHWSGLIGGTHNSDVTFWEEGGLASPGVKRVAETGSKTSMTNEVNAAIDAGNAGEVISGGGIGVSPGSVSVTFEVETAFPLVTVITMIAPSPDWFAGVSGLSLMENGKWLDEISVELPPFDAGTDSGTTYSSPNQATNPPVPIFEITGFPFTETPPVGSFTFTKECQAKLPGDVNNDCRVNLVDFALLASYWLMDCNLAPDDPLCN